MSEQDHAPGGVVEWPICLHGANGRLKENVNRSLRLIHQDLVNTIDRHPEFDHLGLGRVLWGYLGACEMEFGRHPVGTGLKDIHYLTVLIEALDSRLPAEALALVEQAPDPTQLWRRVVFADLLYGEWGYCCVFPELADQIEQFVKHLEAHRGNLIRWGDYPEPFTLAPALDDITAARKLLTDRRE